MSGIPDIKGPDREKPLCYDPGRDKFILLDEIIKGEEQIVPLESLSESDLRKLVIERNRVGPDYKMQSISGPPFTRDDIVAEIEKETEFGKMTVQAEISYLKDLLKQIKEAL